MNPFACAPPHGAGPAWSYAPLQETLRSYGPANAPPPQVPQDQLLPHASDAQLGAPSLLPGFVVGGLQKAGAMFSGRSSFGSGLFAGAAHDVYEAGQRSGAATGGYEPQYVPQYAQPQPGPQPNGGGQKGCGKGFDNGKGFSNGKGSDNGKGADLGLDSTQVARGYQVRMHSKLLPNR